MQTHTYGFFWIVLTGSVIDSLLFTSSQWVQWKTVQYKSITGKILLGYWWSSVLHHDIRSSTSVHIPALQYSMERVLQHLFSPFFRIHLFYIILREEISLLTTTTTTSVWVGYEPVTTGMLVTSFTTKLLGYI